MPRYATAPSDQTGHPHIEYVQDELRVITVDASLGVACVTLSSLPPRPRLGAVGLDGGRVAAWRAGQHCHHLGIERDAMLAARARDGLLTRPMWMPSN